MLLQLLSEAVANRLNTLETKCLKENEGLPKELSEIKADIASLKAKIEQLAEFGEDGTPTLKTPDITDLKRDTFYVHKDLQTMAGYLHVMERDVQSLNRRTDQNYAKLIKTPSYLEVLKVQMVNQPWMLLKHSYVIS